MNRNADADRPERRSEARDERYAPGRYGDAPSPFGGRDPTDYERGGYRAETSDRYFSNERDPFERPDRGSGPSEYEHGGGKHGGGSYGQRGQEDYRSERRDYGGGTAWQPGRQMGDPRRSLYGENVPGPRYGASYVGWQRGELAGERGDDRFGRQGYGQAQWKQQEYEGEEQTFDPDYLQWRAEQIRKLDRDYLRYRRERYKKFCDEFDAWRTNQTSAAASSPVSSTQDKDAHDIAGTPNDTSAPGRRDR
jgi:hypothetical protein